MSRDDVVHKYKGILLSHKRERNNAICSNMDATILLSEISQKEKDKYHMTSRTCGIQNMTQMTLSMKQT